MMNGGGMERVDRIWNHPGYQECLLEIEKHERERRFCRHNPEHFMDVGRLAYLFALESGAEISKEIIYAAALLHDIGRHLQYARGIPHEEASVHIAQEILRDAGFTETERAEISEAILAHRKKQEGNSFPALLYRADKMSRACFMCRAEKDCDWHADKKNMNIQY